MEPSTFRTFADPDDYASALRQGTIELTLPKRGSFGATLTRINFSQLWMQRLSEDLAVTSHVGGWGSRAIVIFRTKPGSGLTRSGTELAPDAIVRLSAGNSYFRHSAGPTSFGGMSLPLEEMISTGAAYAGCELTPPKDDLTVVPSPAAMTKLQRLHQTAGDLAKDAPEVLAHPGPARSLEQALVGAMMDCLGDGASHEDRAAVRQHALIMRRFRQTTEQHLDDPLYLPELCAKVGASEKTLRVCCQEHIGMGPKRYLVLRRLHMVRRALRQSSPASTTVTKIATRYGFWEFGRFAVEYKALFGESPSVTLSRV